MCPWEEYDYEQLQGERRLAHKMRLLDWEKINRRLVALSLEPVKADLGEVTALFTREQITALLDRVEAADRGTAEDA
ncbi:hypothetical protein CLM62_47045 [Streptomyces sp. SA15]|uniref:hypothetical protein n=1 Tax=Streptomyces sp. SA15 TaxID=934019 RepID=UPI000BAF5CCB|nr:hypothetical protein [Streptomyces sp. SA15]PAZ09326.1 hypothetical protein CLM62_47045 [Streptomyces sp. SA15]